MFQASLNKPVEIAVKHSLSVTGFNAGTQIFDARLVEHVGTNLAAPADVRFGVLNLLRQRLQA